MTRPLEWHEDSKTVRKPDKGSVNGVKWSPATNITKTSNPEKMQKHTGKSTEGAIFGGVFRGFSDFSCAQPFKYFNNCVGNVILVTINMFGMFDRSW